MNDLAMLENKELAALDPSKAAQIKAVFEPMVKMLEDFEAEFEAVTKRAAERITAENCIEAKALRLKIMKVRTGADAIRKEQKEEYLRAGQAIQGVYNILKFAVVDKEGKLEKIEKHFERIEAEKIAARQAAREAELMKYDTDGSQIDLGGMHDTVWANFLAGTKSNYEKVKEAERQAEADRLAKEEAERKEQARIKAENEKLKKEAEKREAAAAAERKKAEAALAAEREARAKELAAAEAIAAEEKRKAEEALQKERAEREKIEAAARAAEEKARAEQAAREKEEREKRIMAEEEARKKEAAPDKEKLREVAVMVNVSIEKVKDSGAKQVLEAAAAMISRFAEAM